MRSSQEKQRGRIASTPARRTRPVHYRLTKTEAEIEAEVRARRVERSAALVYEDDYSPFLLSVLGTAVFVFMIQAFSSLLIANYHGAEIRIDFWLGVFPFIKFYVTPASYLAITTWATVTTVVLITLRALAAVTFRRDNIQVLDGRATALLMAGLLLVYQYIRHLLSPPVVDTWIFAQAMAGVIAATVIYLGFRPTGNQSAPAERTTRPTRVERFSPSTQATEQERSTQP